MTGRDRTGQTISPDATPAPPVTVTLAKAYPVNGAKWFDFIKGQNGGTNFFDQPDVACAGSEVGANACIHGGDKLKTRLPGYTTCEGLIVTDALGAFHWTCLADGVDAHIYSSGFEIGKGLGDIIDFTGHAWKENSITISLNGAIVATSASERWWNTTDNPIVDLPDSSASVQILNAYQAGTVLVQATSANSFGYNIAQDKLGLVVKDGATLTYTGSTNNCRYHVGTPAAADGQMLICGGARQFIWVEGKFNDAVGADVLMTVLHFSSTSFSRFNKITITEPSTEEVIMLPFSSNNAFTDVSVQNRIGNWPTIQLNVSTYNLFNRLRIANGLGANTANGVEDYASDFNVFHEVTVSGIGGLAMITRGNDETVTKFVFANGGTDGYYNTGSRNTMSHFTGANNDGGCFVHLGDTSTINQLACIGQVPCSLYTDGPTLKISQVALSAPDGSNTICGRGGGTDNVVTNNILIRDNANDGCYESATNPGFHFNVGTNRCENEGTVSDAVFNLFTAADAYSPYVGALTSNDAKNLSDALGFSSFAAITDWLGFDTIFRAWGRDAAPLPGACTGGNCRIWDYRLKDGDTILKNKSLNGVTFNTAFVAGATCPAAVHGNKVLVDQQTTPNTFLANAMEIMNDGLGDEDGLCESNEACVYSPNFGAYQGEYSPTLNRTCNFENGVVTGVKMYNYSNLIGL